MKRYAYFFQKRTLIFCLLLAALPVCSQGKSITREGEAVVKLVDFQAPEKVKKGELFRVYVDLSLVKILSEGGSIFLHLVNPQDGKRVVHADFSPEPPISSWAQGEVVGLGPICLYAPEEVPAGEYNISLGIITAQEESGETVYVREPYVNPEIKDFVVGKIIFEEAPQAKQEDEEKEVFLSDFQSKVGINKWEVRDAAIELNEAVSPPVAKVKFLSRTEYPALILENFFRKAPKQFTDWSQYDYLEMELYQDPDLTGSTAFYIGFFLQVKDNRGNTAKIIIDKPPPQGTPLRVPLFKFGKIVDLGRVTNFTLFVYTVPQDYTFYIRYVKLGTLKEYRGKGPFVKFEGLELAKEKVYPEEELVATFSFSIIRKFSYEHQLFIRLYDPKDPAGTAIKTDISPHIPTTEWEIGQPIKEGPFSIYLPVGAPAGKYVIEASLVYAYEPPEGSLYAKHYRGKDGVFYLKQPEFPVDYFRQPYLNYQEYGDWIVGSFEVLEEEKQP